MADTDTDGRREGPGMPVVLATLGRRMPLVDDEAVVPEVADDGPATLGRLAVDDELAVGAM